MNQITLVGTVQAKDGVTTKTSQSGTEYANFSLKVERSGANAKGFDFFRVTCWRQLAVRAGEELRDGQKVVLMGKHTNDRRQVDEVWTDNWTVHATEFTVLGAAGAAQEVKPKPAPAAAAAGSYDDDF